MEPEPAKIQQSIKFGRDFELEPDLYELRRSGRVLKLERIPMDVLLLLVSERGRVVERREIVDSVWGKGICLDADNSINGAIRKIRQVLKDDPEQPRFIQTVSGRGYRFIAPVTMDELNTASSAGPDVSETKLDDITPVAVSEYVIASFTKVRTQSSLVCVLLRWRWPILVATAAILIAVVSIFVWSRQNARQEVSHDKLQLAVLPFQNLTGDASQEYFSDGFTEEMITQLGELDPQHLAVIARTSIMHYKNTQTSLQQIGHDLGAQYVLEGSVRRDTNNLRITAQLILMRDQTHVWAREYDRPPQDLLTIQSEIAREITDEIQLTLGDRKPKVARTQAALSPEEYEAHDLYLKGQYLLRSKRTKEGLQGAVYWFQQAVAKDPNYAHAYAGLADSYTTMSIFHYVIPTVYMPQARTAALKALQLDDSLAEAHASLASIAQNYDWDWQTAEREYRRAIQLNENYAPAHQRFSICLAFQGRFDEAIKESERAQELDPLSLINASSSAMIYYRSRQYGRAIAHYREVLEKDPSNIRAHNIIFSYVELGQFKEALTDIEQWRRTGDDPWNWAWEAYVYGKMGNPVRAKQALQQIEDANRAKRIGFDPAELLILAYAGLGDKERWLSLLQEAYRQRTDLPVAFKVDPFYDPVRSDPRFQEMLHGVGLDR